MRSDRSQRYDGHVLAAVYRSRQCSVPSFRSAAAETDSNGIVGQHPWPHLEEPAGCCQRRYLVLTRPVCCFATRRPGLEEMLGSELTLARDGGGRLDVIVASSHGVLHRLQTTPGVAS